MQTGAGKPHPPSAEDAAAMNVASGHMREGGSYERDVIVEKVSPGNDPDSWLLFSVSDVRPVQRTQRTDSTHSSVEQGSWPRHEQTCCRGTHTAHACAGEHKPQQTLPHNGAPTSEHRQRRWETAWQLVGVHGDEQAAPQTRTETNETPRRYRHLHTKPNVNARQRPIHTLHYAGFPQRISPPPHGTHRDRALHRPQARLIPPWFARLKHATAHRAQGPRWQSDGSHKQRDGSQRPLHKPPSGHTHTAAGFARPRPSHEHASTHLSLLNAVNMSLGKLPENWLLFSVMPLRSVIPRSAGNGSPVSWLLAR
jgi:hypothetical protein